MKRIILTLSLLCYALVASGQEFSVPTSYKFSKADDYAKHEAEIVKCFNWLLETPVDVESSKREKASKYLVEWLMGSPTVSVTINQTIVTFTTDADLLMIFMGGWAKYSIESKDVNNKIEGNMNGLEAVIAFYQKNKASLEKDKNIEKYIKLKGKGKLKDFVAKNG